MNLTMITVHIDCLQSVSPFLLDLSSLALSQNDLLTSAVGFAARSSRVNPVTLKRTSYCLHSTCAQMNQNIQCTKVNQTFELFSFTKNGTKLAARNATAKAKSRARKNELISAQVFSLWRKQNNKTHKGLE